MQHSNSPHHHWIREFRDSLAANLGVSPDRKERIYLDLVQSVTWTNVSYWLQVILAAGIATLGLVLNSPAVIIGAMLISPLMGSILSIGLALAVGDLILAVRAVVSLGLSCLVAIIFAMLLVSLLPFKEMTPEILARTSPNVLDLVVALFSGAVGAVAISKDTQGVATSIPGVSIAVALMPPLCVVGYGIGIAVSVNLQEGLRSAVGGGLLFLTNLMAISLMAMVVFLALHIDTPQVRNAVRELHEIDPESCWVQGWLDQLPASRRLKAMGSLPSRMVMVLLPLLVMLWPLSSSLERLKIEIGQRQEINRITQAVTNVWRDDFSTAADGVSQRSDINKLSVSEQKDKLILQLSVFTSQLYTESERQAYVQKVAKALKRTPESIALQLTEIPTAANTDLNKLVTGQDPILEAKPIEAQTVAEAQRQFLQTVNTALASLQLPDSAVLLQYDYRTTIVGQLGVDVVYLSDRSISEDLRQVLQKQIKSELAIQNTQVQFIRIPRKLDSFPLVRTQATLDAANQKQLDQIGQALKNYPLLIAEINLRTDPAEPPLRLERRQDVIRQYLASKWQVASDRIIFLLGKTLKPGDIPTATVTLNRVDPVDPVVFSLDSTRQITPAPITPNTLP